MAALSSEFHAYLQELEKIKNWEKLPHDDPRIVELQRLSNATVKMVSFVILGMVRGLRK